MQLMNNYVALDIETANSESVCQIGMVFFDSSFTVNSEVSELINPEAKIEYRAYEIHHITEEMVKDKPNFLDFWNKYSSIFYNNIIVCHNKSTDLVVIDKNLEKYGIDFKQFDIRYIDTCELCKRYKLESANLEKANQILGLEVLEAHDALNDAKMCFNLFKYFSLNCEKSQSKIYDGYLSEKKSKRTENHKYRVTEKTKRTQEFLGSLKNIYYKEDLELTDVYTLYDILQKNLDLQDIDGFDKLRYLTESIVKDNQLNEDKKQEIVIVIRKMLDPREDINFFEKDDCIIHFAEKRFAITGEFSNGWKRDKIKELIENKGGKVTKSVSTKTNYLIVGDKKSDSYALGTYGEKIKNAKMYGIPIVSESTFLRNIEE